MIKTVFKKTKYFLKKAVKSEAKWYPLEESKSALQPEPELIRFNKNTLNYYRKNVNGNSGISKEQANRKISRNMALAFKYKEDSKEKKTPRAWYAYGKLRFMVSSGEVKWIQNHCEVHSMWSQDSDKYYELSDYFKIENKHIK